MRGGLNRSAAAMEALRLLAVTGVEGHLQGIEGLSEQAEEARRSLQAQGYHPRALEAEFR